MADVMKTVGETLVDLLEAEGVDIVFGIPGVHTVELYRGLARSAIRHITPRHEQGAGFMADGYARVSGKPGVCLVITGPGLTNTITAMAQARQDSVPMLVISGVNRRGTLGHGIGALHELPDQRAMMKSFALHTHTLLDGEDLQRVMAQAFAILRSGRPGPVHIEIPVDVMSQRIAAPGPVATSETGPQADRARIAQAARLCAAAKRPVILAGGGAKHADAELRRLAEALDAPVVTTVNGRGILAGHPLQVPASPTLPSIRNFLVEADLVLAFGTEFGQTDYDMSDAGDFPVLENLVRIDIDREQLARVPATLTIASDAQGAARELADALGAPVQRDGAARAKVAREAARAGLNARATRDIGIVHAIVEALPGCIIVGDSTQLVYAANMYCEIDRPAGWFNAATGYGALGFGPPAAIGAALAAPGSVVVCLTGDGGLQFSLAELGAAVDAATPVIFLVWNNHGYREIESYMVTHGIEPEGVKPSAPDFVAIAQAYRMTGERVGTMAELEAALLRARDASRPVLIEMMAASFDAETGIVDELA